jgi:TPR repeat protein
MYSKGQVVEKDEEKYIYHLEEGAIGGHPTSRYNLGCIEVKNDNFERARKHFIISANLGWNDSLKCVRTLYADGHATKEDYAGALRGYQAAVDATKSNERKKAEEALKSGEVWAIC